MIAWKRGFPCSGVLQTFMEPMSRSKSAMSRLSPNFTASPRARKKSRASEGVLLPEQTISGCTSRQRRRYRFAPSALNPRKPIPKRLRWTRRRTRLIPAGRKVFMRLKPSPNIVSSAPSPSPSAASRKNDSRPEPEGRASKNEHASLWAWTRSTRRNRRSLPEEGGQPGNAPRSASASGIWASCASNSGDHFPSNISASNVPTALSAYHAFSFAISFSFAAAHRPFGPRQHSRPETRQQYTKMSVFKTKKRNEDPSFSNKKSIKTT